MLIWKYVGYGRYAWIPASSFQFTKRFSLYLRMQTRRLFYANWIVISVWGKCSSSESSNCCFKDPGKFVNFKFLFTRIFHIWNLSANLFIEGMLCASTYFNKLNSLKAFEIFANSTKMVLGKHFQASASVQLTAVAFLRLPFLLLPPPPPVECLNLSYLLSLSLANYRYVSLSRFSENACLSHHQATHFQSTCRFYCPQWSSWDCSISNFYWCYVKGQFCQLMQTMWLLMLVYL